MHLQYRIVLRVVQYLCGLRRFILFLYREYECHVYIAPRQMRSACSACFGLSRGALKSGCLLYFNTSELSYTDGAAAAVRIPTSRVFKYQECPRLRAAVLSYAAGSFAVSCRYFCIPLLSAFYIPLQDFIPPPAATALSLGRVPPAKQQHTRARPLVILPLSLPFPRIKAFDTRYVAVAVLSGNRNTRMSFITDHTSYTDYNIVENFKMNIQAMWNIFKPGRNQDQHFCAPSISSLWHHWLIERCRDAAITAPLADTLSSKHFMGITFKK